MVLELGDWISKCIVEDIAADVVTLRCRCESVIKLPLAYVTKVKRLGYHLDCSRGGRICPANPGRNFKGQHYHKKTEPQTPTAKEIVELLRKDVAPYRIRQIMMENGIKISLPSIERIRMRWVILPDYEALIIENKQLRERIEELEKGVG